ncbi:MAG TPA: hypothetical protein VII92_19445 [Anaerolineae bacterium]
MIEITLHDCQVQVAGNPAGQKVMIFIDKNGIRVVVPLTSEAANQISHALSGSGIIVPSIVPPGALKGNTH